MSASEGDIIREGDWVVVKLHDEQESLLLASKQPQKVGRSSRVSLSPLIGEPFGSFFEVSGKNVRKLSEEDLDNQQAISSSATSISGGDNRSFSDTNTAQKLTPGEIDELRAQGATGKDIIQSLIANSESWTNKSEFSQEKWLRRKQKKYMQQFRVLKCTPGSICRTYYQKNPSKLFQMRPDVLGLLLSHGGIYSGGRALIYDDMLGLVVGAAAYQMRGKGNICAVYFGQQPHFDLVDRLNLSVNDLSTIRTVPSQQIADASNFACNRGLLSSEDDINAFLAHDRAVAIEKQKQNQSSVPSTSESSSKEVKEKPISRPHQSSGRQMEDLLCIRSNLRQGFHSLVIATGFHPLPLLKQSLPLLRPSSPIIIYCEFREPLTECFVYLQHRSLAIKLQLIDPWMREFQVLAERCHPQMTVNMTAGCILTGVVVSVKTEHAETPSTKRLKLS